METFQTFDEANYRVHTKHGQTNCRIGIEHLPKLSQASLSAANALDKSYTVSKRRGTRFLSRLGRSSLSKVDSNTLKAGGIFIPLEHLLRKSLEKQKKIIITFPYGVNIATVFGLSLIHIY